MTDPETVARWRVAGKRFAALTLTGAEMANNNPRIITLTVRRLRMLANELGSEGLTAEADKLRAWADELNDFDARETRKDPSKRRKAR